MKKESIDIIIRLIELQKMFPEKRICFTPDYSFDKDGLSYILGQLIRQIRIPKDHCLVSVEAQKWWNDNAEGNIMDFYYRDPVTVKQDVSIPFYIGNKKVPEKEPKECKKGDTFVYRSFFHDEHIVPVSTIIKELIALETPTAEKIGKILDKIYICKMLKSEDKKIGKAYNRGSDDYRVIIKDYYHKNGIQIWGMDESERENKCRKQS